MRQHAVACQQRHHQIFFGLERRHVHHRIPPAAALQDAARRRAEGQGHQLTIVRRDPRGNLRSDGGAAIEQFRGRRLHRRRHREIGVAHQFQPRERGVDEASGPLAAIQPSFTCGNPADLDSPPSANERTSRRAAARPARRDAPGASS
jgi:hypothetical protein